MQTDMPRRAFIGTSAAAIAAVSLSGQASAAPEANSAIRPFTVAIPQGQLNDLRRRLVATRWPIKQTVADQSQGVQLAKLKALVEHWIKKYDWRRFEARLNSFPQFTTRIDGLGIHFLHIRSKHRDALPLILTHGWPGSIAEMLKVIGPLSDPTAHGGKAEDAFHLVIPSMPGYGFSEIPTTPGWGPDRIARAWHELMRRLGYQQYVSQGGDWGAVISDKLAAQKPPGLLGIHVNMPATVPPDIARILNNGDPAPKNLAPDEKRAFDALDEFYRKNTGYSAMMVTRPQTVGYGLFDSPVGLAA